MTGQTLFYCLRAVLPRVRAIAACTAGIVLLSAPAARADICSELRSQLRAVSQVGAGTSAQARRYADAATRQALELDKTLEIRRARGCFGDSSAACQSLYRTIRQMQANLEALERQRDRLSGGRNSARIRAIEGRLERNRCNEPQRVARENPRSRSVTIIPDPSERSGRKSRIVVREGIGRQRLYNPLDQNEAAPTPPAEPASANEITISYMPGTFRTLCVRTCDGYYFPVSFSTGFNFLQRDAQACEAMCPATEAKLFFHRVPDQESEDMISLQGQPYRAMSNAFLYRERSSGDADPSCSCGTPRSTASAPDEPVTSVPGELELSAIPTPVEKPEISGGQVPSVEAAGTPELPVRQNPEAPDTGTAEAADASKKVRVVGPEFLPAPEGELDLRSPDPTSDP